MTPPGRPSRQATPLYARPAALERPLRVVLVGPPRIPAWIGDFLGHAGDAEWIELHALAVADATLPRVADVPRSLRALVACERAVLGPDPSLAAVDLAAGQPPTQASTLLAQVAALQPDVVILLGLGMLAAQLADLAQWGCWQVDPSLTDPDLAGLSLLAPILANDQATFLQLQLQGPTRAPLGLAGSWGRTRATAFQIQRRDAFRKLAPLLLRTLHRIADEDVHAPHRCVSTLQLQSAPLGRQVASRTLFATFRGTLRGMRGALHGRHRKRGWMLLERARGPMLDPEAPVMGPHAVLRAPRGWWADPFIATTGGRRLVFIEEMAEPASRHANIACLELVDGGVRQLGTVLDEPGHLSFPRAFQWQGQWNLTVETSYDNRVSLYRTDSFPGGWVRTHDLISGRVCVDPVLHHHDGHWYLFVNIAESGNSTWDELFLFVSEQLEGPFLPHPASPIVSDVRRARMAGSLFLHRGRWIRPAQDCAPGYGTAIAFNEIIEFTPTTYRERALSRMAPDWSRALDCCHTYTTDGAVEIIDALGLPPRGAVVVPLIDDAANARAPSGRDGSTAIPGARVHARVASTNPAGDVAGHRGRPA